LRQAHFWQLLGEEPGKETLNPFKVMDVNVRTTKTRFMAYFPFELLEPLLGSDITAHQVFELIVPVLIDVRLEDTCSSLIEFLILSLMDPIEERSYPYTLQQQLGNTGYVTGPDAISHRREHVLYHDHPDLMHLVAHPAASDPALVYVARGMRDMVAEAIFDRNYRAGTREESRHPHTIHEKMGEAITDHFMLLCHATNDEELPAHYREWVTHPRGVSKRWVFQQAVNVACATQGMPLF
jgi:hypothetical protein